jgi:septal ring factor EnvC (AmiA/AmiB activator)
LRHLKARLLVEEEHYRSLQSEHDALQRRFGSVQSERDMLHQTFEATLQWVQQRNADKQARLHQRLDEVQNRVEEKVLTL